MRGMGSVLNGPGPSGPLIGLSGGTAKSPGRAGTTKSGPFCSGKPRAGGPYSVRQMGL